MDSQQEARLHTLELDMAAHRVRLEEVARQAEQVGPLALAITRVEGEIRSVKDWMTSQVTTLREHITTEGRAIREREDLTAEKVDSVLKLHAANIDRQERDRKQIKVALIGAGSIVLAAMIGFAAVLINAGPPFH